MAQQLNSNNPKIFVDRVQTLIAQGLLVKRLWHEVRLVRGIFFDRYVTFYFAIVEPPPPPVIPKPQIVWKWGPEVKQPIPDIELPPD